MRFLLPNSSTDEPDECEFDLTLGAEAELLELLRDLDLDPDLEFELDLDLDFLPLDENEDEDEIGLASRMAGCTCESDLELDLEEIGLVSSRGIAALRS